MHLANLAAAQARRSAGSRTQQGCHAGRQRRGGTGQPDFALQLSIEDLESLIQPAHRCAMASPGSVRLGLPGLLGSLVKGAQALLVTDFAPHDTADSTGSAENH